MTLNHADVQQIKQIIQEAFDEKMKFLPTKDEFFQRMDEMMGEDVLEKYRGISVASAS